MKCPYCHIDFFTQQSYEAHVAVCGHKDNPLPVPPEEPAGDKPLSRMNKDELTAKAKELGLQPAADATKAQITELIEKKLADDAEAAKAKADGAGSAAQNDDQAK